MRSNTVERMPCASMRAQEQQLCRGEEAHVIRGFLLQKEARDAKLFSSGGKYFSTLSPFPGAFNPFSSFDRKLRVRFWGRACWRPTEVRQNTLKGGHRTVHGTPQTKGWTPNSNSLTEHPKGWTPNNLRTPQSQRPPAKPEACKRMSGSKPHSPSGEHPSTRSVGQF